ncbi:MAG: thioredoxin family protein [Nibricoccus sp.]
MKYLVALFVVGLIAMVIRTKASNKSSGRNEARGSDIQRVIQASDQKTLLVFWKPHCPGCEKAEPMVAQLEKDYPAIQVIRINTSLPENRSVHDQYEVHGTPTLVLVEKGKTIGRNEGGFANKQGLLSFVKPSKVY